MSPGGEKRDGFKSREGGSWGKASLSSLNFLRHMVAGLDLGGRWVFAICSWFCFLYLSSIWELRHFFQGSFSISFLSLQSPQSRNILGCELVCLLPYSLTHKTRLGSCFDWRSLALNFSIVFSSFPANTAESSKV